MMRNPAKREQARVQTVPIALERAPSLSKASIAELIARRAASNPHMTAVVEEGRDVSYGDLEGRSNQLARHLQLQGVESEHTVGLYMQRSVDYVVGALAILKAGGAYVPLDPASPVEHLRFMLNDAGARLLLSHRRLDSRPMEGRWKTLDLDAAASEISSHAAAALEFGPKPNQLAYVIYTSGSTGKPKGVEIEHKALLNLVHWHARAFDISPGDRVSQFAGLGFDAAVWEIWPNLAAGASLHLVDEDARREPERLRDWIVRNRITVCFAPTPVAEHLIRLEWPATSALRLLLTGGDALRQRPLPHLPFEVINNYGPTECTVVSTSGRVSANSGDPVDAPSIGAPIDNTIIYILDENRQPVITGQTGELYIAGLGVARGYRNSPDLTRRCFVNPFGDEPKNRCYQTGDLARSLPTGEIQFAGRADDQIEIRGHRVEPGQIAGVLNVHPEVRASVVVAQEDSFGDKHLTAYVVCARGAQPGEAALKLFLQTRLPAYMIPRKVCFLEELPLNPSGKVDRPALSSPIKSPTLDDPRPAAANSGIVDRMSAIVSSLLDVEQIGTNENFFLLGGHSLLGAQLIARIRETFGVELSLRTLFEAPTIAELSACVSQSRQAAQ